VVAVDPFATSAARSSSRSDAKSRVSALYVYEESDQLRFKKRSDRCDIRAVI